MSIIEDAAEHIQKGEVETISVKPHQIVFQVGDHIVTWNKKAGRTLDTCDCENHARFCNENPRCSHKLAASTWAVMRRVKC